MADIITVGGVCADVVCYVPDFYRMQGAVEATKYRTVCGGKSANQIVAAAKLGASTSIVSKVGKDGFGKLCMDELRDHGVNTDHVSMSDQGQTSLAVVSVNTEGKKALNYSVKGVTSIMSVDDVMAADPLIQKAKVMLCNMALKQEVTLAALKLAKKHSVTTILTLDVLYTTGPKIQVDLLKYTDIVCCNKFEAACLTDLPVSCIEEARLAVSTLLNKGARSVVMTMRDAGAVVASQDEPDPIHVSCQHVKVVDITGAGDGLAGALAFFTWRFPGLPLEERVRRSSHVSTASVQKEGTIASYPRASELPTYLFS